MKKVSVDKVFAAAVRATVAAAIAVVFLRNVFPSEDNAIIIESVAPAEITAPSVSGEETPTKSGASAQGSDTSDSSLPESPTAPEPEQPNSSSEPSESDPPSSVQTSSRININTATLGQLKTLSGIGDVKARAIIDYREQNGGFGSVDELVNVSGIGSKTLENIREYITV